ncbi:antibiotic biosynthesis monooxygenase family protein [Azospirillum picis]|uniref:Quinol monooxygenase YgiN n=1 Tax=Azospirillum picis TaxID=488438 RepID=A0ABU0MQL9_9PROT|nr:antibiotic biosynthesis monooxygenase [Azospirillum picis]MBP2302176.1 quinol monooxygenase YgiN [Azospirillum picis]MDQ0535755.1 quinol monooxygenase YgiN [Azospirillum picis]
MAPSNAATIEAEADRLTLINVYEVEPEKQVDLSRLLSKVTEDTIRHQPGFVSVCIHTSLDGSKVVNYAQWESKKHFQDFMAQPAVQEELKRFAALAKSVTPSLCMVDAVHVARA